jgi:hypothetical protein
VHTLVTRYEKSGPEALKPRSRRPHANPTSISVENGEVFSEHLIEPEKTIGATSEKAPAAGQANKQKKPGI